MSYITMNTNMVMVSSNFSKAQSVLDRVQTYWATHCSSPSP